jgi:quercetin dioxygenase-like cupin family protein
MAKCIRFSFVDDLPAIVEDGLFMRAVVGDSLSVGVVKFVANKGAAIPAKPHAHGEEASLQIEGGCRVSLGDTVADGNQAVELDSGNLMLMPAQQPHYGVNRFSDRGICLRLNVVTPPRREFGEKGRETSYYPVQETSR